MLNDGPENDRFENVKPTLLWYVIWISSKSVAADAVPNEAIARTNAPQTLLKNLIVANLRKIDRNIFVKQSGIQKHAQHACHHSTASRNTQLYGCRNLAKNPEVARILIREWFETDRVVVF